MLISKPKLLQGLKCWVFSFFGRGLAKINPQESLEAAFSYIYTSPPSPPLAEDLKLVFQHFTPGTIRGFCRFLLRKFDGHRCVKL